MGECNSGNSRATSVGLSASGTTPRSALSAAGDLILVLIGEQQCQEKWSILAVNRGWVVINSFFIAISSRAHFESIIVRVQGVRDNILWSALSRGPYVIIVISHQ
ncbi:hypothetical protein BPAE_0092g00300 [Botrytis paeoniae]|uniref:Uncharacterized protein n=1 Tax=Botrytis paeoniae TaxID=278948 RepID=A0A4Z1FTD6_9HELO|nr:hypothetical protein BPAE_0092g00300 [Botrytis paeoniae]